MKNKLATVAVMALLCSLLHAQAKAPERTVYKNTITSQSDPSLRIELPRQVIYLGADRWNLFDVADCEIHIFVEADAQKNIQRLYWIQFEGFLPSKPDMQHNYKPTESRELAGMTFDLRARVGAGNEAAKPGSDLEHVQNLIRAKGYKLPAGLMNVRFVHLLDEKKRKELMIIYGEDVKPTGFTAEELFSDGKGYPQWPAIAKAMTARAVKQIQFKNVR